MNLICFDDSMFQPINGPEYFYLNKEKKIACRPDDGKRAKRYFQQDGELTKIYIKFITPNSSFSLPDHVDTMNLLHRLDVIEQKMATSNTKRGFFTKLITKIWNSIFPNNKIRYFRYDLNSIRNSSDKLKKSMLKEWTKAHKHNFNINYL